VLVPSVSTGVPKGIIDALGHAACKGRLRRQLEVRQPDSGIKLCSHVHAIPPDLRAALRIQPTNVEALTELAAVNEELEERRQNRVSRTKGGTHKRRPSDESDANSFGDDVSVVGNGTSNGNVIIACEASTSSPPHPHTLALSLARHFKGAQSSPPTKDMQLTAADTRRLRLVPLPLSVNVEFSRLPGFGKKRGGSKTKEESFAYPSWDRYVVKPA
jgi:hypothetical protein